MGGLTTRFMFVTALTPETQNAKITSEEAGIISGRKTKRLQRQDSREQMSFFFLWSAKQLKASL